MQMPVKSHRYDIGARFDGSLNLRSIANTIGIMDITLGPVNIHAKQIMVHTKLSLDMKL